MPKRRKDKDKNSKFKTLLSNVTCSCGFTEDDHQGLKFSISCCGGKPKIRDDASSLISTDKKSIRRKPQDNIPLEKSLNHETENKPRKSEKHKNASPKKAVSQPQPNPHSAHKSIPKSQNPKPVIAQPKSSSEQTTSNKLLSVQESKKLATSPLTPLQDKSRTVKKNMRRSKSQANHNQNSQNQKSLTPSRSTGDHLNVITQDVKNSTTPVTNASLPKSHLSGSCSQLSSSKPSHKARSNDNNTSSKSKNLQQTTGTLTLHKSDSYTKLTKVLSGHRINSPLPEDINYHYSQSVLEVTIHRLPDKSLGFSVLSEFVLDGLQVTDASDSHILNGDIIREINNVPVKHIGLENSFKILQNRSHLSYKLTLLRIDPADIYEISLTPRKNESLGISIQGTEKQYKDSWVMVTSINPDSILGKINKISIGDELLAVNDTILLGHNHDFAVSVLVKARESFCRLVFVRGRLKMKRLKRSKSKDKMTSLPQAKTLQQKLTPATPTSLPASEPQKILKVKESPVRTAKNLEKQKKPTVDLVKTPESPNAAIVVELPNSGHPLGINIIGGEALPDSKKFTGIYISKITKNSLADLSKRICVGHKILAVNGINVEGRSHDEFLSIMTSEAIKHSRKLVIKIRRNTHFSVTRSLLLCHMRVTHSSKNLFLTLTKTTETTLEFNHLLTLLQPEQKHSPKITIQTPPSDIPSSIKSTPIHSPRPKEAETYTQITPHDPIYFKALVSSKNLEEEVKNNIYIGQGFVF